jgi:hypothetical protein
MFSRMMTAGALALLAATAIGLPSTAATAQGWSRDDGASYQLVQRRGGRDWRDGRHGYREDRRWYREGRRDYGGGRDRCRDRGTGGTIIGAIAGGLLGDAAVGRRGDGTAGALVGAGVGALAGRSIDRSDGRRC